MKTFSPADSGTSEQEWLSLLCNFEDWRPGQGPLVVVAPHPDDEILGAGGLVHAWAMAGHSVTVLSVTDGEGADIGRPDLDRVRRAEVRSALRTLSMLHVEVRCLGIPDGRVRDYKYRLRTAVEECAQDQGTLVAPYEHDGHPDHDAAGEVCLNVAQTGGIPIARYPIWTWHHTSPAAVQSLRWGLFRLGAAAQRAKKRAIQCFESQLRPPRGLPIVPEHVLAHFNRPYEAFVL